MPAGLPGSSPAQNQTNPSLGVAVIFDLLSGPKGSPFDNDKDYANAVSPFFKQDTTTAAVANLNCSTGALSTGIGMTPETLMGPPAAVTIGRAGFTDDYKPGISTPLPADSPNSTYMYIGGGKCTKNVDGLAPVVPYVAGFGIGAAGSGGTRDQGAGPAYTGFTMKLVTATASVANGAAVEAGFLNRVGFGIGIGDSVFGVSNVASAVPS
jgi:hypothetical protein